MESTIVVTALAALAQEHRLAIYRLLVQAGPEGRVVGQIAEALNLAPATLSFHLKNLTHAGLINAQNEGRFIHYRANFAAMHQLINFLSENCCGSDLSSCAC
ncbi:MAG: ArsR family transcriptional regulator [Betaproteobacteria bacterium]|nr:MAG: ArsR family transcriptional regulator [Betaproteobacteria bacterium]